MKLRMLTATALLFGVMPGHSVLLSGHVVGPTGNPVGNATVSLEGKGLSAVTNTEGEFLLEDGSVSVRVSGRHSPQWSFQGSRFRFDVRAHGSWSLELADALGQRRLLASGKGDAQVERDLEESGPMAPGIYFLLARMGSEMQRLRFAVGSGHIHWPSRIEAPQLPSALAKSAASQMAVSASGFATAGFAIDADTALDLRITLYPQGAQKPGAVTVTEGSESRNFIIPTTWKGQYQTWFGGRNVQSFHTPETKKTENRSYRTVTLGNEFLEIVVAPELGMRVLRATDKLHNEPLFAKLDNPANDFGRNQTMDMGGIKPSYPFYEHGTGLFRDTAGYYVRHHLDGSVSLVMNLHFEHHQMAADLGYLGQYTDRPLTGVVTLRPGSALFEVHYIAHNPNPLRRSDRIWNNAQFPADANAEILFPVKWATGHGGRGKWDITKGLPDEVSIFGLPQYPFAGAYYPGSDANHIRIADPKTSPGTKFYTGHVSSHFVELWGSTNRVFESPEQFVHAFESVPLSNSFWRVQGIGKVSYANHHVAVSVSDKDFELTAPVATVITVYEAGSSASPILENVTVGPGKSVSGTFQNGLRVVSGGSVLCDVRFPLPLEDDGSELLELQASADRSGHAGGINIQPANLDARWQLNYELEGSQNNWTMMNSLAAIPAAAKVSSEDNAAILLSMANTAYRHGAFTRSGSGAVGTYLQKIGAEQEQGVRYLKALVNLENGEAADFSGTPIEGRYFQALQAVAAGKNSEALSHLDALVEARPRAVRPRLLRGFLRKDVSDVLKVLAWNPGIVEAWAVLKEMGYAGASGNLAGLLKQNSVATTRAEDFVKEITQGVWRHERRFEFSASMFESSQISLGTFPEHLKY